MVYFDYSRYHPYPGYPNSSNGSNSSNNNPTTSHSQPTITVKSETTVSSVSTSGAPLSPLVEPHSNTSTPLVDEPHMSQRQRNGTGDDGEFYFLFFSIIFHKLSTLSNVHKRVSACISRHTSQLPF